MNKLLEYFIAPYESYTFFQIFLEGIAALFGILSVYFSMKRNRWVYPTGILSTIIYIFLLFRWGLYGETLINVYYTLMSIYGWVLWSKGMEEDQIHVRVFRITKKESIISAVLFVFSFLLVLGIYYYKPYLESGFNSAYLAHTYTLSDYIDTFLTATFLVGMWLMARRKVESWLFWIIGDFIAIFLFIYKGYPITSIQYVVFFILAVKAYKEWAENARESLSTEE